MSRPAQLRRRPQTIDSQRCDREGDGVEQKRLDAVHPPDDLNRIIDVLPIYLERSV